MKVSDLTGAQLDYWVMRAEQQSGGKFYVEGDGITWVRVGHNFVFRPSKLWDAGGPIIEREGISVVYRTQDEGEPAMIGWRATYEIYAMGVQSYGSVNGNFMDGPTPLIAAMRAYVASKFGDEVGE